MPVDRLLEASGGFHLSLPAVVSSIGAPFNPGESPRHYVVVEGLPWANDLPEALVGDDLRCGLPNGKPERLHGLGLWTGYRSGGPG